MSSLQKKARKFEKGLLKYEVDNGRIWPPSSKGPINICVLNQRPIETRCHDIRESQRIIFNIKYFVSF